MEVCKITAEPTMNSEASEATESQVAATQTLAPMWARSVATFFGAGRMQPGPGTWGSLAAILVWVIIAKVIPAAWQPEVLGVLIVTVVAAGIPAATSVCRSSGIKDPQFVVIDEVAGQWITLLLAPVTWKTVAVGFILFRGFDIVKPPPVRQLERLSEGTGIVADDIAAGIYALAIMQVLLHTGFLR
jgi:phosphatidylglycerophosphatase A